MSQVVKKIQEQTETIRTLTTRLEASQQELAQTKKELVELEGVALAFNPETEAAKANAASSEEDALKIADLEAENKILQKRLDEALLRSSTPATPVTPVKGPVSAEEYNSIVSLLEQASEDNDRLSAEVEASQEIADAAAEEVGTLSAVVETLQEEKRALEAEKTRAQADLKAVLSGGKPSSAPLPEPPLLSTTTIIPHSPEEASP